MRTPGFTAEASLQRTGSHYHTATGFHEGEVGLYLADAVPGFYSPRSAVRVLPCVTECASICRRRCQLEPQRWCGANIDLCFRECVDINCCKPGCEPCRLVAGQCQQLCHDDHCAQGMQPCTCPGAEVCCPQGQACGSNYEYCCKPEQEVCRNQGCCGPCGNDCCPRGTPCINGKCCPPDRVCGSECCEALATCTSQGCCPYGKYCGNDVCCDQPGKECSVFALGHCCTPGKGCVDSCCDGPGEACCAPNPNVPDSEMFCGKPCGGVCIRKEDTCCGEHSCLPGYDCCLKGCCPSGTLCCGTVQDNPLQPPSALCCAPGQSCCAAPSGLAYGHNSCCQFGESCCGLGCCYPGATCTVGGDPSLPTSYWCVTGDQSVRPHGSH
jgi:hypothetical protein